MTQDSALPPRTHNNPPDPIEQAVAPFNDAIEEAANWLDGSAVTDEAQMKAVDAVLRDIKAAHKAVTDAQKSATAPLHDAWKAEIARWKPTLDDLDMRKKGLVALVDAFKRKLAAEKAEAERKARAEAEAKMRAAQEAARKANAADLEAQHAARQAQAEADEAARLAARASRDTVKGLRETTMHEVTDYKALLHWVAKNDKDALAAFLSDYARKHCTALPEAAGVRVWREKVAV